MHAGFTSYQNKPCYLENFKIMKACRKSPYVWEDGSYLLHFIGLALFIPFEWSCCQRDMPQTCPLLKSCLHTSVSCAQEMLTQCSLPGFWPLRGLSPAMPVTALCKWLPEHRPELFQKKVLPERAGPQAGPVQTGAGVKALLWQSFQTKTAQVALYKITSLFV